MAKIIRLPNGIRAVCDERPGSGTVLMEIYINRGSIHETPDELGLTNLTQEAMQRGTKSRSFERICEEAESKGGGFNSETNRTETVIGTTALTRHAEDVFAVLSDIVRNPAFSDDEIKNAKDMVIQRIQMENEEATPEVIAKIKHTETVFGEGQPAGLSPLGTEEKIASFTKDQIRRKYSELMSDPGSIVLSFAGDIDAARAKKLAAEAFGDIPAVSAKPKAARVRFTGGDYRQDMEADQLVIRMGFRRPADNMHDLLTALMLKEVLAGGMTSLLHQEIREKRGLAYYAAASASDLGNEGLFTIGTATGKDSRKVLQTAFDCMGAMIKNGVDNKTLDAARGRLIKKRLETEETSTGTSALSAKQLLEYDRLISLPEYEERLKEVTADDLRRACAQLFAGDRFALTAVGPLATLPAESEIKAMMKKQLEGADIPVARAVRDDFLAPDFNVSAKRDEIKDTGPQITELPNGLKIVTLERPTGLITCGAWVNVGSDNETVQMNGATHMIEHMMFKGTEKYAAGEIDRIIEGELSGGLNAMTGKDKTLYFFFNLLPSGVAQAIDCCAEMVFKARIEHDELDGKMDVNEKGKAVKNDGERHVVIEEIRQDNGDLIKVQMDQLMKTAYPGQPHGRPILGTEKTLNAMTVEGLREYRDRFYVPNNVIFAAAGPVKHEDFVRQVTEKCGDLPRQDVEALPRAMYKGGYLCVEDKRMTSLCSVAVAAEAPTADGKDRDAFQLLDIIMCGGRSSRLSKKVIEEKKLTTDIGLSLNGYRNAGTVIFHGALDSDKIRPFIDIYYSELRALIKNVTQEELDKARTIAESALLSQTESNQDYCMTIAESLQDLGRVRLPKERLAEMEKVTLEDVQRAAKKILKSNPAVLLAVPPGTDRKHIPDHAEIVAMRDGQKAAQSITKKKKANPGR